MSHQAFSRIILLTIAGAIILCQVAAFGISNEGGFSVKAEDKIYSLVRITNENVEKIKSLNIDKLIFRRSHYRTGGYAEIILEQSEIDILRENNINFDILVEDVSKFYVERNKDISAEYLNMLTDSLQHMGFGSMGGFYTFNEAVTAMDSMKFFFPDLISEKDSIGASHRDNPIWMVKISDNPDINEDEPELLYTAIHHANEPQGLMSLIYFMWYLLENYGVDNEVTYLVDNREMYFIPVLNPDGYMYNQSTNPSGGGMWRKNRRDNGDGTFGVDLNRNYEYMWGFDNLGSSPFTGDDLYRGPEPFSEPETQTMRDFILDNDIKLNLNFHTFGNIVVLPFGYNGAHTPDVEIYESYGANVSALNGYNYGTPLFGMGMLANGCCEDWMYGEQTVKDKVLGFAVEVGDAWDGFWPAMDKIFPLAEENVEACMLASKYTGALIDLEDYYVSSGDFLTAGATNSLVSVLKNIGLSDCADSFSVTLFCEDPQISVSNDSLIFAGVLSQGIIDNASNPFQVYIPPSVPIGYYVSFNVKIKQDSLNAMEKSFPLIVGMSVENSAPTDWVEIELHQMLGYDYQCALDTRFEGYGRLLEDFEGDDGLIYRYFLTGKFYLEDYYTGQYNYLYRLWAFLDLDSNGEIPRVPFPDMPFGNPTPYDTLMSFHMIEGYGEGFPVLSGSVWYEGDYNAIEPVEQLYSVYASGHVLEYEGVAYEGFEIGGNNYYLVDGTLYDVSGDSLTNPQRTLGTLKYDGSEYQINLESGIWEDYTHQFIGEYYDDIMFPVVDVGQLGVSSFSGEVVKTFALYNNYPNPFNPSTNLTFSLLKSGDVSLIVYDILGREVARLVDEWLSPGAYHTIFDGENIPSGVYIARLTAGDFHRTQKLLLIK